MARKTTKPKTRRSKPASTPKQSKSMFRAGTWVAILLFVLLAGGAYLLNRQAEETADVEIEPVSETEYVFNNDNVVTSIEVSSSAGDSVKLERNEENLWVLIQPEETEADQGLAEAAASQATTMTIVNPIEGDPSIFGLDEPAYSIVIGFESGVSDTLKVGEKTPTNSGYYARLGGKMMIVSRSAVDSLVNLLSSPPYLSTPTVTPTATLPPTETPVPPTEAESTPEATTTSTP